MPKCGPGAEGDRFSLCPPRSTQAADLGRRVTRRNRIRTNPTTAHLLGDVPTFRSFVVRGGSVESARSERLGLSTGSSGWSCLPLVEVCALENDLRCHPWVRRTPADSPGPGRFQLPVRSASVK